MYKCYLKRSIEFLLASLGVIILAPLLVILCLTIKLDTKGPVFFCQKRVGKNKSLFTIYKFRTMRIDAPEEMPTHLLENPDYFITRVGKFLRKYSLDELPQLFNIIKGEMAIIGPRPALWNQADLIEARDKYGANDIRPGLTGLAQISGRDELAIPIKASFDGHYAQHITVAMDMKCFLGTIVAVFKSSGVVEGSIGMVKIEGEKE